MKIVPILLAIGGLMAGPDAFEEEPTSILELVTSSHAHDGASHEHGDADDHHDGPDTPCHHSDTHCCCTHAPVIPLAQPSESQTLLASQRVSDDLQPPRISRSADSLPHVPRA